MNKCFNGLTTVNVELTTMCNKNCWMCGRRKIDKEYPEIAMEYGDMVSICVRLDPKSLGIVGDCTTTSLVDIWNSPKRKEWLRHHIKDERNKVPSLQ